MRIFAALNWNDDCNYDLDLDLNLNLDLDLDLDYNLTPLTLNLLTF